MATVQANIIKLLQRIDPRLKTMVEVSTSNIATWATDGTDKFTAQRVVDIYNDARFALFNAMRASMPQDRLSKELSLSVVTANLASSISTDILGYALPAGYHRFISLVGRYLDGSVVSTNFLPIILLDYTFLPLVRSGQNPYYTQSETNRFVFEKDGYLFSPKSTTGETLFYYKVLTGTVSTSADSATVTGVGTAFTTQISIGASISVGTQTRVVTAVASATSLTVSSNFTEENLGVSGYVTDYKLTYYGITTYTISDVSGGSTTESINPDYYPLLIELAVGIANGMGNIEADALAKKLISLKG